MRAVRFVRSGGSTRSRSRSSGSSSSCRSSSSCSRPPRTRRSRRASSSRCRPTGDRRQRPRGHRLPNNLMVTAMRNSLILTGLGRPDRAVRGDGRFRPPAPARPDGRGRERPDARRADHPAGDRPDDLRAAGARLFKTLPGLILVEVAFLLPFSVLIFRPSSPASRASSTRPRSWTARHRCACSSR